MALRVPDASDSLKDMSRLSGLPIECGGAYNILHAYGILRMSRQQAGINGRDTPVGDVPGLPGRRLFEAPIHRSGLLGHTNLRFRRRTYGSERGGNEAALGTTEDAATTAAHDAAPIQASMGDAAREPLPPNFPQDWKIDRTVRANGKKGTRFFLDPAGKRYRSEVAARIAIGLPPKPVSSTSRLALPPDLPPEPWREGNVPEGWKMSKRVRTAGPFAGETNYKFVSPWGTRYPWRQAIKHAISDARDPTIHMPQTPPVPPAPPIPKAIKKPLEDLLIGYAKATNAGYPRDPDNFVTSTTATHRAFANVVKAKPQGSELPPDHIVPRNTGSALCEGKYMRTTYYVGNAWRELNPHQKDAVCLITRDNVHGLLLYHGMGTGKTLTSIACVDNLLRQEEGRYKRVLFVLPSAMVKLYSKVFASAAVGPAKDVYFITHHGLRRMTLEEIKYHGQNSIVVVDEVHRLRVADSALSMSVMALGRYASKLLLLTGTPVYNNPRDIAPLINAAKPGSMPLGKDFDLLFGKEGDNNPNLLRAALQCSVLYHFTEVGFPTKSEHSCVVRMSERQYDAYKRVTNYRTYNKNFARTFDDAMKADIPEAYFDESFMILPRQVCNGVYLDAEGGHVVNPPHDPPPPAKKPRLGAVAKKPRSRIEHGYIDSNKIEMVATRVKKLIDMGSSSEYPRKSVIYTHFKEQFGVDMVAYFLEKKGIKHGPGFRIISGGMSPSAIADIVNRFNWNPRRGDPFPAPKRSRRPIPGKDGEELNVLVITDAAAEGLDLKGCEYVHVVEPQWNRPIVDQVIGRACRFESHKDMPEDRRNVHITRYYAMPPTDVKKTDIDTDKDRQNYLTRYGADVVIEKISDNKYDICSRFLDVVQAMARENATNPKCPSMPQHLHNAHASRA